MAKIKPVLLAACLVQASGAIAESLVFQACIKMRQTSWFKRCNSKVLGRLSPSSDCELIICIAPHSHGCNGR